MMQLSRTFGKSRKYLFRKWAGLKQQSKCSKSDLEGIAAGPELG